MLVHVCGVQNLSARQPERHLKTSRHAGWQVHVCSRCLDAMHTTSNCPHCPSVEHTVGSAAPCLALPILAPAWPLSTPCRRHAPVEDRFGSGSAQCRPRCLPGPDCGHDCDLDYGHEPMTSIRYSSFQYRSQLLPCTCESQTPTPRKLKVATANSFGFCYQSGSTRGSNVSFSP
jgi:hypothetical protein